VWFRANDKELKEIMEGLGRLFGQSVLGDGPVDGEYGERLGSLIRQAVREAIREEWGGGNEGAGKAKDSRHTDSMFRELVERHTGRLVRLHTHGGTVEGTISEVGEGYAVIREDGEMSVLINLDQAVSLEIS
jgi:hypothetical protein